MESSLQIGPYRVLEQLGPEEGPDGAPRSFLAVGTENGHDPVVLSLPPKPFRDDTAYHVRFRAQAENSRRLKARAVPCVLAVSPPEARPPWIAYDYVPAVTLSDAVSAHGGALPEPTVRVLGIRLAEALAETHAQGLVHAGISTSTVLLAGDGPRLLGYGAQRTAASGWQAAPEPPADIFDLGTVLAYAATGIQDSEPSGVAGPLAPSIACCLERDPCRRPPASELSRMLAAPQDDPDWLPHPVALLIERQRAAMTTALRALPPPRPPAAGGSAPAAPPGQGPVAGSRRRSVLVASAAGLAGAVLGGVSAYALSRGGSRGAEAGPRTFPGVPPQPLWSTELPGAHSSEPPLVVADDTALFVRKKGVAALDLHTGEILWESGLHLKGSPESLGNSLALLPGGVWKAVSVRTGEVEWSSRAYDSDSELAFHRPLSLSKGTLFFEARRRVTGSGSRGSVVVAYDVESREQLWQVPLGQTLSKMRPLVQRDSMLLHSGDGTYTALSLSKGKKMWSRQFEALRTEEEMVHTSTPDGLLIASLTDAMVAIDVESQKTAWTFKPKFGWIGASLFHEGNVYVTDSRACTYALDARAGYVKWRQEHGVSPTKAFEFPTTSVSKSGRTLLACNAVSIDAYERRTGRHVWRFTPLSEAEPKGFTGRVVGQAEGIALVQNKRFVYALPVD